MKRLALEKKCDHEGEHYQRDNLLDDFQLPEAERATVAVEAEAVGWDLGAIFKESQSPREENDQNERPASRNLHFLKLQMAVPCECHEYVGKHQQKDSSYSSHHVFEYKRAQR